MAVAAAVKQMNTTRCCHMACQMSTYSESQLREIYRRRIDAIEDTAMGIQSLGIYAMMNSSQYAVFTSVIEAAFYAAPTDLPKQRALIHLVNEIVQNEAPDVRPLFRPLIERMMIKAAETRDADHIRSAKRVLEVLFDRKILDAQFFGHVMEMMDSRQQTGADEETVVGDRFLVLIDKLVHAKQAKIRAIEEHKSQEDVNAKVTSEIAARRELMDMCTQQLNRQMQRVAELEKRQKSSEKVDDLFAGNEEEDDDDSATVV